MKKILLIMVMVLFLTSLVGAQCSTAPTDDGRFSYIQECDDDLTLHFNLDKITVGIEPLKQKHASVSELGFIIGDDGVVRNCQVKKEGDTKTISGRPASNLVAYCEGIKLRTLASQYEGSGASSSYFPKIANSLRRFEQFLVENTNDLLDIRESILLDENGRPFKGQLTYPFKIDNQVQIRWVGGIIDDEFDESEMYQVSGAEIDFEKFRAVHWGGKFFPMVYVSDITFNDPESTFVRERKTGLQTFFLGTSLPVEARFERDWDKIYTQRGSLRDEWNRKIEDVVILFTEDGKTLYCCPDLEETPSEEVCMTEPPSKTGEVSFYLKKSPGCDYTAGGAEISMTEGLKSKSKKVNVFFPEDIQKALCKIAGTC